MHSLRTPEQADERIYSPEQAFTWTSALAAFAIAAAIAVAWFALACVAGYFL